ncbi:cytochrome D1 domain-containing protein [Phragmitibacter flavus]|nr:cytochrome D1 domain-containing protein [Phragmitibacter flavus]
MQSSSLLRRAATLAVIASFSLSFSLSQAADLSKGLILCTNKGDQTLSLIDSETNKEIVAIPEEGITGHEVIASKDGKLAFVPIFGDSGVGKPGTDGQHIQVIDLAQKKIVHTIDLGRGLRPHCPIIHPITGDLYVTTENENSITIVDGKTFKVKGSITTGQDQSHMLIISNDGKRGYTSNVGPGTVSVLDLEKNELIKIIPISKICQRIAVSNDDKFIFTSDQTMPQLVVIDATTLEIVKRIDLGDFGYGAAPTPDGKSLVLSLISGDRVGLIDLEKMELTKTVSVPRSPQAVIVRPDGKKAYVSCDRSAQVAVIDLETFKVDTLIQAGKTADGLAWAPAQ